MNDSKTKEITLATSICPLQYPSTSTTIIRRAGRKRTIKFAMKKKMSLLPRTKTIINFLFYHMKGARDFFFPSFTATFFSHVRLLLCSMFCFITLCYFILFTLLCFYSLSLTFLKNVSFLSGALFLVVLLRCFIFCSISFNSFLQFFFFLHCNSLISYSTLLRYVFFSLLFYSRSVNKCCHVCFHPCSLLLCQVVLFLFFSNMFLPSLVFSSFFSFSFYSLVWSASFCSL